MRVSVLALLVLVGACHAQKSPLSGRSSRSTAASTASSPPPSLAAPAGEPPATPSPIAMPPASSADPSVRLVAIDPRGALCVLDADSGALRSRHEAFAVDLCASRTEPGVLATIEPSEDESTEGALRRYALQGDALVPLATEEFSAPGGRLLDVGAATVGVALSEGWTLFHAQNDKSPGKAWGTFRSFAAWPEGERVRVQTASLDDGPLPTLREARLGPDGVEPLASTELAVPAPDAIALFAHEGGPGRVTSLEGKLHITGGPLDGREVAAPGDRVVDALWLGSSRGLAVLVGPEPALWSIDSEKAQRIALGGEALGESTTPEHRMAFDATRERLWVVAGQRLVAVGLDEGQVVATSDQHALAVAMVR